MIIKLVDGAIMNIDVDGYKVNGCETCDYGSRYCQDLYIYFTKYKLVVEIVKEYEFLLSLSDVIIMFTQNLDYIKTMTEQQTIEWIIEYLKEKINKVNDYSNKSIDYNIEEINL